MTRRPLRSIAAVTLAAFLVVTGAVRADGPPAPPYPAYPPPPPVRPAPAPRYAPPPPPRIAPPPPLSPLMRVVYAPFYVAGLIVRYGVYYVIVAPLEVFGRTVDYGAKGGAAPGPAEGPGGATAEGASPRAAIPTYGLVQLRGVPDGASVDLDGRFWLTAEGLDARWLALPEGRRTVTVRNRNAAPLERTVDVMPGKTVTVQFRSPRQG